MTKDNISREGQVASGLTVITQELILDLRGEFLSSKPVEGRIREHGRSDLLRKNRGDSSQNAIEGATIAPNNRATTTTKTRQHTQHRSNISGNTVHCARVC